MEAGGGGREKWKPFFFCPPSELFSFTVIPFFSTNLCGNACCAGFEYFLHLQGAVVFLLLNVVTFSVFTLSLEIKGLETSIL